MTTTPEIQIHTHTSQNFSDRKAEHKTPTFIIIHGMCMDSDKTCLETLCCPKLEVSSHYFIDETGKLFQLVPDDKVAWHAGISSWGDIKNLNDYSIGIELSNPGVNQWLDYNEPTYQTLIPLLQILMEKYNIPAENILAHSDIAPNRKDDPSEHFDWQRLEDLGLAKVIRKSV